MVFCILEICLLAYCGKKIKNFFFPVDKKRKSGIIELPENKSEGLKNAKDHIRF